MKSSQLKEMHEMKTLIRLLVFVLCTGVLAENTVEVISPDERTTNAYETVAAALAATENGSTIRMLSDFTWSTTLVSVSKSLKWNLNGFTLKNSGGDFLKFGSNTTNVFFGGGTVGSGGGSKFCPQSGSVVNVTNVTVTGQCVAFGSGTVNVLADAHIDTEQLGSANCSGLIVVHPGAWISSGRFKDSGRAETDGAPITAYGGCWNISPTNFITGTSHVVGTNVVAGGKTYRFEVVGQDVFDSCEVMVGSGLRYATLAVAVQSVTTDKITLLKDIPNTTPKPSFVDGKNITLDLGGHVFSTGGSIQWISVKGALSLTNGTIRVDGSGTTGAFGIEASTTRFSADATVSFLKGSASFPIIFLLSRQQNANIVLDGCTITTALFSHNTDASDGYPSLVVRGDAAFTYTDFSFREKYSPSWQYLSSIKFMGGTYNLDPERYLGDGCIKGKSSVTERWRVWNLAEGMKFDLAAGEVYSMSGTCDAPPTGPITVSLAGTVPTRKTLLADMAGLTFSSGEVYNNLSFVKDSSLPLSVVLEYVNGKLYVWEAKGTVIAFR